MNGITWFQEIDRQFVVFIAVTHAGSMTAQQVMSMRLAFHCGFQVTIKFFRDNDMAICNYELGWEEYLEVFKIMCVTKQFQDRCEEIANQHSNRN